VNGLVSGSGYSADKRIAGLVCEGKSVQYEIGMSNARVTAIVTHRFSVPAGAVYDAWLSGAKIRKWFAPDLGEMVRVAVDARVGGWFSFVQRRGMDDIDHCGNYLELDRPRRIAFTWQVRGSGDDSRVSIDIEETADGCALTLHHELHPRWQNYTDKMAASWDKMLTAMEQTLNA
jgi:uncharacterized protein YndB with AHSA1/START domain